MLNTTKLIIGFLLTVSLLSCNKEDSHKVQIEAPTIPIEEHTEPGKPKHPPLESQIQLMLEGKEGDQAILRHAIETIEWDVILKTWKNGIKLYEAKHGKKSEKKHIVRVHSILSLIQSEVKLADVQARKKQGLKDLEDTIKSAIKKEQEKKQ